MTDKEKQIEEMSRHVCTACAYEYNGSCDLHRLPGQCHKATAVAEALYEAGCRKQVEGEWLHINNPTSDIYEHRPISVCPSCGFQRIGDTKFCENCGAKMKGGG